MQTHSDMCVHSRVPEQQSEAFTYRPANRTGCGGSRVDDFHVFPVGNCLQSALFGRDRVFKGPLSSSIWEQARRGDVIRTMSSRYFFFRDWWRSRSWLAMSLYWSRSCWHVSSSLERISRASFLLSSFLLHTRYCGTNTSTRLRTATRPPSFHPRWSSCTLQGWFGFVAFCLQNHIPRDSCHSMTREPKGC